MSDPAVKLMVAIFGQVVCIKVAGKANFGSSTDLKKMVNELFQRGHRQFVIDLSECVMMDSTFLGTLAGIGLKFTPPNGKGSLEGVELLNPTPRIYDLLENLGVAHLFKIVQGDAHSAQFEPVELGACGNRQEVTKTCLEAHQTLMQINPDNVQKFKDVAQFLAEDLKRMETAAPPVK